MMEAYQIAGAAVKVAQAAFTAGSTLYSYIQDVERIEETAQEFARETQALGAACYLVGTRVRSIVEQQAGEQSNAGESQILLACLGQQLEDCSRTIEQLQTAISCADQEKVLDSGCFDYSSDGIDGRVSAVEVACMGGLRESRSAFIEKWSAGANQTG
jgi:uncharacterized protein YukE